MKIIASDFDGTITYDSENMLETNKRAIEKWRKAGNLFGIVTGRGAESIGYELNRRGIECDFILANNGCLSLYKGEVLFEETIDRSVGVLIRNTVFGFGCEMLGYDCRTGPHGQIYNDDTDFTDFENKEYYTQFNTVCSGETVAEAERKARRLCETISEKHGDVLNPLLNGRCIDICPVGCDKGTGIVKLAGRLNIPHENVFTVGDNYNDLAMLKRFSSFAMNNAYEEVKRSASMGVTLSVANMIECLLMR